MQPEADQETIEKAINGSREAFNHLMNVYKNQVYYLCLKMLKVREDAEEVAQDVFVKLHKNLKKFRGESRLSTWIFRIAYNDSVSKIRKNRKRRNLENIEEYNFPFIEKNYDRLEQHQKSQWLEAALDLLDEESKALVLMFYYHDKSVDEIAIITKMTRSNVKIKLFRARKRLLYVLEKKFKLNKTDWI